MKEEGEERKKEGKKAVVWQKKKKKPSVYFTLESGFIRGGLDSADVLIRVLFQAV